MSRHQGKRRGATKTLVKAFPRAFDRAGLMAGASPLVLGLVAAIAGVAPAHAQAVNLGGGVNNIIADGRTNTSVTTSGSTTSITTRTISGGTGFNSFSDFQQAANTRVDLYVPDGAGNLVNIVRNGPVVIDGTLNSYKDGHIGGNVFFASSQGFVVGAGGVVNVGSLGVSTPTREFIDGVVRPDGSVNDAMAGKLMRGVVPLSADGLISIAGVINAKGGVSLQGHEVNLAAGGAINIDGRAATHREIMDSAVNTGGLVEGTALAMRNGVVSIVASGNVHLAGVIDASAKTPDHSGGDIAVKAGGNVTVDGVARLSADGAKVSGTDSDAGSIKIVADDVLLAADNAKFTARGTGQSAGGFVELSGHTAIIGGINTDLGSEKGKSGTLLFDPFDLYVGGLPPGAGGNASVSNNIVSNGANVSLQADNSITVISAGVIDTRSAAGASGNIDLAAPLITIADGARLQADVTNGSGAAAGNITLTAERTSSGVARILIGTGNGTGPVIAGNNVTFLASANVDSGLLLLSLPTAKAQIEIGGNSTITASGIFKAEATAAATGALSALPIGVVVSNVLSSVTVGGHASITAASVELKASSTATSRIGTTSLAPSSSAADGAVAVSTVNSDALVNVGGSASIDTAGALDLIAENNIVSEASAVPNGARFGASVAVSVVKAATSATIGDDASIASDSLKLDATTEASIKVVAQAAQGGGGEPESGSKANEMLGDGQYGKEASTSEGKISVVGGLGISDLTATTTAKYASSVAATVTGQTDINATSTTGADVVADGSAVDSTTGVGVAVGINLAHVSTVALVQSALSTDDLSVGAKADGNVFSTTATSGAGAKNVGVAGSLASNIVDTEARAALNPTAAVTLTGTGKVDITASNEAESKAIAKPTEAGATGDKVGVGVSAAINVVANRSTAEIADGADLVDADKVTIGAKGKFNTESEAKAGSSGGISVTPALALNLASNATTARVGTGALLTIGSLDLSAVQQASNKATVESSAAGSKAAIGAGLAISMVDDIVTANVARSLTATGDVKVVGMGVSLSELSVSASASGAAAADESGDAPAGDKPDVDSKVDSQLESAQTKQANANVGDSQQRNRTSTNVADKNARSASTSEGKVSVAAAVGVNVQSAKVAVEIADAVAIDAGGTLTVRALGNTDGKVTADGSAVMAEGGTASQVGIGAAVAVNKIANSTTARLGNGAHTVGGLTIEALKGDVADILLHPNSTNTRSDTYLASATSGAGGSKIGIAGSLGLNLIDNESDARIAAGATVNLTGAGAVHIAAENQGKTTAAAKPVETGATGGKVGVGVSAAINIVANRSTASVADGVTLNGAGPISLVAEGTFETSAEAKAGSSGGVSVTPALGLNLINNTTTARLGTGSTLAAGSVALSATQQASTTTSAKSAATGGTAAVGMSLALALVNDTATATTGRSLTTTGAVSFTAGNKSTGTMTAEATASGAKPADDTGGAQGEKNVDGKVNDQLASAQTKQTSANVGNAEQQSSTNQGIADKNPRSAKSSEGKLAVAAAAAVNVTKSVAQAEVPDAVVINAGGALTVSSLNTTSGALTADGSAVGGANSGQSQVGVGVAAAVNVLDKTNTARLGVAAHSADGVHITATQFGDQANPDVDTISASAASGAGGSKVGIAGSLALNIITARTNASIASGASVNAGAGASTITADQRLNATGSAQPIKTGATGGKVGVGASVAINTITATTSATLADGAVFTHGAGLAVKANSAVSTTTKAAAGAAGGVAVDAVVALALLNEQTTARIGTSGTAINTAGAVSIEAISGGKHLAEADGNTKSGSVGIGASAALIFGTGAANGALSNTSVTSASLARNLTATALDISATGDRGYDANATATAKGGVFNEADEKKNGTTGGTATSADSLDKTKDSQKGTEGGGKVTVAAAVGIAAAQDVVSASIDGVTVNTGVGAVSVDAANSVGMATSGNGMALNSQSQVGVGIGVALSILNNSTSATIADGSHINQSGSVDVTATALENTSTDYKDKATAVAFAGASSSKVSVAGALAVAISTSKVKAVVGDNVVLNSAGAVNVAADNTSKLTARSLAGSYTSGNVGVGASVATIYSQHAISASIGAGTGVTAASLAVTTNNHKFTGPTIFSFTNLADLKNRLLTGELLGASNYYAEAMGGAASAGSVAVQGSFAVMVFDDQNNASIGRSQSANGPTTQTTITTSGAVVLKAESDLTAKSFAGGIGVGNSAGVGVSSAVIVSSGTNRALFAAGTVVNAGSVTALAKAGQDIKTFGISAAGGGTAGIAGVATVVTSENTVETLVEQRARIASSGAVGLNAQNDIGVLSVAGGAAAGGDAGIGAAASVLTVNNVTRAALANAATAADAVYLDAAGAVAIGAKASETADTFTAAGAASQQVAVGAGAAVYVLGTRTEAFVGTQARVGQTTKPSSLKVEAEDITTLSSLAGAGAGAGTVGAGAGASVGVLVKTTYAAIAANALVRSSDVRVAARSAETGRTIAAGVGIGGTAGIAGAVGVYSVTDTTTAEIGNGAVVFADNNVAVLADDDVDISFLTGALAGGGTAAVGASAAVTVIHADTNARIASGASVTALGLGAGATYITGYSADLAGFGVGGAPNVTAPAINGYSAAGGNDTEVLTADEAMRQGLRLLLLKRTTNVNTATAQGVVVNASGQSAVRSLVVGAAGSGTVGVAISGNVPVILSTIAASVADGAQINVDNNAGAGANQSVTVAAASDVYRIGISGSVGIGTVGVGAGVETAVIRLNTGATIGQAQVNAKRDVVVTARASEDYAGAAAAAAVAAGGALAGGFSILALETHTNASVAGTVRAGGNVVVLADDVTRSAALAGSAAVDVVGAGVGGSVSVAVLTKRVSATVAANADIVALGNSGDVTVSDGNSFSGTRSARGLVLSANSNESFFTLGIAGAGGFYAGVAGAVSLQLLDTATTASIGANAQINANNAGADSEQDVTVVARDSTSVAAIDGGIAVSLGAGVSGAVDIGVLRNTTAARIEDGATVRAADDVDVVALQNVNTSSTVISAAGGLAGIAAGVSVYSVGDGIAVGSEGDKQINSGGNLLGYVQGQLADNTTGSVLASSSDQRVRAVGVDAGNAKSGVSVALAPTTVAGISASIGNAGITSGGAANVVTRDQITTNTVAGAAAGGIVSLGAGIGIVTVESTNAAQIVGTSALNVGSLSVNANSNHNLNVTGIAGTVGYYAALQASLALVTDNSTTRSFIAGSSVFAPGAVAVNAAAVRAGTAKTYGASLAVGAAAGLSYASVNLGGGVEAKLARLNGQAVTIGSSGSRAGSVAVTASSANSATAETKAVSGGIGAALLGALAEAEATTTVTTASDGATIYTAGETKFDAQSAGRASTDAKGLSLGGLLAAGGSLSKARVAEQVSTTIGAGTVIDAGSIVLKASVMPNLGSPAVSANAWGSSGALVGLSATDARALNTASANVLAIGSVLRATGELRAATLVNTGQYANASGLAIGIVAAGSNTSEARSTTVSQAILRDMVGVTGGDVRILANGSDSNFADATSGSGGLIAGSAASATTNSNSTTRALADTTAQAGQYTLAATGQVQIKADHAATFGGKVDSVQAAVVGASGATINHTVNSIVDANLSDNAKVRAASLAIQGLSAARNFFIGEGAFNLRTGGAGSFNGDNADWNVNSGSGGLINLPAGSSTVTVNHATTATIGANADVLLIPAGSNLGNLTLEAYNETVVHQKGKLDSGGLIATAASDIHVNVVANATAAIGANSKAIVSVGDVAVAAWGNEHIDARSAATTYGLAGAPSGEAFANYLGNNTVNIGTGVTLMAAQGTLPATVGAIPTSGTVSLSAGTGLNGEAAKLSTRTTVDLYNKTAIPISTTPDARTTVTVNSALNIADSQNPANPTVLKGVLAAGDITLRAVRGSIDASAVGTGKDIYREALAKVASAISNAFGGGDVTFDYHGGTVSTTGTGIAKIDGLVATGIARYQTLLVDYLPNCAILTNACVTASGSMAYTVGGPDPVGTDILNRVRELKNLKEKYKDDPIALGAYSNEIRFLEDKLVSLGLGTRDNLGNFVAGTYAGPSPKEAAQAILDQNNAAMEALKLSVSNLGATAVMADSTAIGANFQAVYSQASYGVDPAARAALQQIAQLSKHAALMDSANAAYNASYKSTFNGLTGLIDAGVAAANQVASLTASNASHQATINALTKQLADQQLAIQQALANPNTTGAQQSALDDAFANTQSSINTELLAIASNNASIRAQADVAKQRAVTIQDNLITLRNLASAGTAGDNTIVSNLGLNNAGNPAASGALFKISQIVNGNANAPSITTRLSDLNTYTAATDTRIGGMYGAITGYAGQMYSLSSTLVANAATVASAPASNGSPMAYSINVADAVARLGNISIVTDRLVGSSTGSLAAPGDAKIEITNNTANTLKLGNLLIPTYDAGNVRLNGVLVASNSQINALQGGNSANFASVITGDNSSRPTVSIVSNYNPESLNYYNPGSTQPYLNTPRIAPDIILKQGATIDNPDGAVSILSASGNIYVNGTINAGSVSILAKNGDFVSSYVNGFKHIGGDPASFNSPTNASEAGLGITANGAISIAARFININSTIQSGIANWTLNLGNAPTLTTNTPASIGLTQDQIKDAIDLYKTQIAAAASNPASVPSAVITLVNSRGQNITLNMAPAGMTSAELVALNSAISTYLTNNSSANPANPVVTLSVGGTNRTINLKDFLSAEISGRLEFSMATAATYTQQAGGDGVYAVINDGSSNIGVAYDTKNVRYVVDGTSVHGGYIQLYGQVMNTAGNAGALKVLDGFGTINITNTSNIPVVLQTLNAGADDLGTGRGTQGKIDITDIVGVDTSNAANPVINVKRSIYTRDFDPNNASGQVKIAIQNGHLDNKTGDLIVTSTASGTGADRTASYTTTANQRYVWTTGEYKETTTTFTVTKNQLFGADALTLSTNTALSNVSGPHLLNSYRLPDGTYVTLAQTQVGNAGINQTATGLVINQTPATVANSDISGDAFVKSTYAYFDNDNKPEKTGESRDCNWWTLCIDSDITYFYKLNQKYTTITTNSLKADNPIAIEFIGSNQGAVNVNSASDVVLMGNIKAANGTVAITSTDTGSIVQGDLSSLITAHDINLSAAGSVGGLTYTVNPAAPVKAAVAIDLKGGALNATAANGNVAIAARGGMVVDQIKAVGNVHAGSGSITLSANGSITGVNANALIQAPRVSLTSVSGAIGSTASQLHVNTGFSTAAGDRVFGDPAMDPNFNANPYLGLSASARGDIGIYSNAWSGNSDGTMLVDKVASSGGNVRLTSTGHILDNNPVESIDQRTYAQLLGYWNSLGLVVSTTENAQKQAANIAAFERSMDQSYTQYWQIRAQQADGGASYDANFTYKVAAGSQQYAALSQQFDAQVRAANPGWTDAQVAQGVAQRFSDYEAEQTSLYHSLNGKVGGLTGHYDANYAYTASAAEQASLSSGAAWTERELAFSLSPGALKTVTATNPVVKAPNVAGRSVSIEAQSSVGETIGAGTANVGVTIPGNLDPSLLTVEQRVALASAERSDLQLTVHYNGANVVIPLGTEYENLTPLQQAALDAAASRQVAASDMTVTVLSKRPLNFNAIDQLNVTVAAAPNGTLDTGTAHLASRGDAPLGTINVQGETRIKVLGNIYNAPVSSISTGNLVLEAAQGSIGFPGIPLRLTTGNATFTGRAANGVYVNFNGNGVLDTVYSPNAVNLRATGALLNANGDRLLNVLGKDVTLTAGTTIGTANHALNVGNNLGGGITATAGGLINLFGPVNNFFVIKGATSASGGVTLTAGNNGTIDGQVQGPGRVTLTAGNRFTVTAAGTIRSIADDIALSAATLKMLDGATMTADIGRVSIDTSGDAQVTGIEAGSNAAQAVTVTAGGRIYAGNAALRPFDIAASSGGVKLVGQGIGDKTLTANDTVLDIINPLRILAGAIDLTATAGSGHIAALGPITQLTASVAGNLGVTAAGQLLLTTVTTAGYQDYVAQGRLSFDTLTATGPNGNVTAISVNGDLAGGNITASGSIKLGGAGVVFGTLLAGVDSRIASTRDIIGSTQIAGNAIFDYAGTPTYPGWIRIGTVRAKSMVFDAVGGLDLPNLEVADSVVLAAPQLNSTITQVPAGTKPLEVSLTGAKGGVGIDGRVRINAPAGVIMPQVYFVDADVVTTAKTINVLDAFIPGQFKLTSPLQTVLDNNRSPGPLPGNNIQLYQLPGQHFGLGLDNYHTSTNAFVVKYDVTSQATFLVQGLPFHGVSLVRDSIRAMFNGDPLQQLLFTIFGPEDDAEHDVTVDTLQRVVIIDGVPYPIAMVGDGPAVQLGSLN